MAPVEPIHGSSGEFDLVWRCRAGEREAFEELFYLYRDDLFRFAFLVVRDPILAQDAVQEAFLKVYRSIGKFQFRSSLKSWLYRIAVNEAITLLRRRKIKEDLDPTPGSDGCYEMFADTYRWQPEEMALQSEERDLLHMAIGQLDPIHRTVVVLKYFQEFSDPEIAAVVGCPPGTVKSRLHRARELLRSSITRHMEKSRPLPMIYAKMTESPI